MLANARIMGYSYFLPKPGWLLHLYVQLGGKRFGTTACPFTVSMTRQIEITPPCAGLPRIHCRSSLPCPPGIYRSSWRRRPDTTQARASSCRQAYGFIFAGSVVRIAGPSRPGALAKQPLLPSACLPRLPPRPSRASGAHRPSGLSTRPYPVQGDDQYPCRPACSRAAGFPAWASGAPSRGACALQPRSHHGERRID